MTDAPADRAAAAGPPVHPNRLWALAGPVLAENALLMAVNLSDTVLAGRFFAGESHLAAMTAVGYLLWLLKSSAVVVGAGAFAAVARDVGAGAAAEASRTVRQALLLALAVGVTVGGLTWTFANAITAALLQEGPARALAATYLRIFAFAVPFDVVYIVAVACMRAAGYTRAGMHVGILINVVNIALCWTFVTGWGSGRSLGWPGLALGTSLAFGAGGLYAIVRLWRGVGTLAFDAYKLRFEPSVAWRILRIGIPGAAASVGLVLCHLTFVRLVGGLGEAAVAAHGIAIQLESLSYLLGEAFAYATAALVGQALGARDPALARACAWAGIRSGAWCMGAMGALFWVLGPTLCRLFTSDSAVAELGGSVVRIMAWVEAPLGALIVTMGVLRGAGDTRSILAVSMLGLLAVRIPLAYWLAAAPVGWGLWGAWLAMAIDILVRLSLAFWRFRGDAWMKQRV